MCFDISSGHTGFILYKCGTNVLLRLSIKCNPKRYESTNQFEKYKGIKKRDMCGMRWSI